MIVIDVNILVHLFIINPALPQYHSLAWQLFNKTGFWIPPLWQHEFHNAVVTLSKHKVVSLERAKLAWKEAVELTKNFEHEIDFFKALDIAHDYKISGYDAQYVALAEELDLPLITEDVKLRKAVPHLAKSMEEYLKH